MRSLIALSLVLLSSLALAKPVRKPIEYKIADQTFEGVLIHDDSVKKPRPGLLLVPNWLGVSEDNLKQAEEIAGKTYVIFVADMFGKGAQPKNQDEAAKASGAVKADRPMMRARAAQALQTFLANAAAAKVDTKRVAAIGFCFGGTTAFELAKSGADIRAAVGFHATLDAPLPQSEAPKAKILALQGADDPFVPAKEKQAFLDDMKKVKADWTLVDFGGQVHSFTDKKANAPGQQMYDEKTSKRAYQIMQDYLSEAFGGNA
jgi:dienelactone hydrolase